MNVRPILYDEIVLEEIYYIYLLSCSDGRIYLWDLGWDQWRVLFKIQRTAKTLFLGCVTRLWTWGMTQAT